jgi:hypothetical protein
MPGLVSVVVSIATAAVVSALATPRIARRRRCGTWAPGDAWLGGLQGGGRPAAGAETGPR